MPYRRLYHYLLTYLKAKSASDPARVPVTTASSVTVLKRGAYTQGSGNDNAGTGATITVHDRNEIVAGDIVYINVTGGTNRTVLSVTATTLVLQAGGGGTFAWADGDRIISTNTAPTLYSDEQGVESVSNPRTTSAEGVVGFYAKKRWADVLLTEGSTVSGTYDVEGETETEVIYPEDFGAVRDANTNDGVAFTNAIAYLKGKGGGVLQLGIGTYRCVTPLTIDFSNIVIRGMGRGLTTLRCNAAVTWLTTSGAISDVAVEDISFDPNPSTGSALYINIGAGTTRFALRRCNFNRGGSCITDAGTDSIFESIEVFGSSVWSWVYNGTAAVGTRLTNVKAAIGASSTGGPIFYIDYDCLNQVWIGCEAYATTVVGSNCPSLFLGKSAGTNEPRNIKFIGCRFCAGQAGDAVQISNAKGVQFIGVNVEDSLHGYVVTAGQSFKWVGGTIVGIQREAIDVNGGSHIRVVELETSDIGIATNNLYDVINVAAGVDDVSVWGMTVGTFIRGSANKARWGVRIEAGLSDRVQIMGIRGILAQLGSGWYENNSTGAALDIGHNLEDGLAGSYTHTASPGGSIINAQANPGPFLSVRRLADGSTTYSAFNTHTVIHTPTGNVTITGITGAVDGQTLTIINRSGAFTITFGHGVSFFLDGGTSKVLNLNDAITLKYLQSENMWVQVAPLMANG